MFINNGFEKLQNSRHQRRGEIKYDTNVKVMANQTEVRFPNVEGERLRIGIQHLLRLRKKAVEMRLEFEPRFDFQAIPLSALARWVVPKFLSRHRRESGHVEVYAMKSRDRLANFRGGTQGEPRIRYGLRIL